MRWITAFAEKWHLPPSLVYRLPMVVVAVLVCYCFEWGGLRHLTSEICLRFAEWRGLSVNRLGPYVICCNGSVFRFDVACTYADVFCGAIPLIWIWRLGMVRNLTRLAGFVAALFGFNIFHLCLTDLIFSAGAPWFVADQVIGGMAYFAVWVYLIRSLEFYENHPALMLSPHLHLTSQP
ncbi:MAG: hypothetical protein WBN22_05220 [Verrucomicrobiia bacterium]